MKKIYYNVVAFAISVFMITQAFCEKRPVPAVHILEAARRIVPQTSSLYAVTGKLECYFHKVGEMPPFWVDSGCLVHINNQSEQVDEHEEIIAMLLDYWILQRHWEKTVNFTAISTINVEAPNLIVEVAEVEF